MAATRTIETASDLAVNITSFERYLRAGNLAATTRKTYIEAARIFGVYLAANGMPQRVAHISREHIENFIGDQLSKWKPATAANRLL